jgi:hypothetical protein
MLAPIYVTLGYGKVAYVKMLIYWITFAVGSITAPYCARRFGYKNCLIMGTGAFYVMSYSSYMLISCEEEVYEYT